MISDSEVRRKPRNRTGWVIAASLALLAVPIAVYALTRTSPGDDVPVAHAASAEEEPVDELKLLRKAVTAGGENREQLRTRVLEFRAKHPGTAAAAGTAGLLKRLPSPLDKLAFVKEAVADVSVVLVGDRRSTAAWLAFSSTDDRLVIGREGKPPEEYDFPALKETSRLRTLPITEDGAASVTPDARTVMSIDTSGKLAVWSNGKARVVDAGQPVLLAALTPDGKSAVVAFNSDDRLTRINLETGKSLLHLDHPSEGVVSISISPDGGSCLAIGPENLIRVLSLSTGKLSQAFDSPSNAGSTPDRHIRPGWATSLSDWGGPRGEPLLAFQPKLRGHLRSGLRSSQPLCAAADARPPDLHRRLRR